MSLTGGIGDTVGELFVKIKPDGADFAKDLEGVVGDGTKKALGNVQRSSQVALGAVTAVGGGLLALGTTLDDAYDKIRVNTGATGDSLAALEQSFDNVAKNSTQSLDSVSTTVADLNQRLGLTGGPLESLSGQFLDLAQITGTDVASSIESVTALYNQFNITGEEQSKVLNDLFQASQASGLSVTELADAVNKGGAVLSQFGLTTEQQIDFVALLGKNGITTREALTGMTRVVKDAAKAGVPAADAFKLFGTQIKNASSDTEAAGIAIEAFGPKGLKLAQQIRDGTIPLENLGEGIQKALAAGSDSISDVADETADAAESFAQLKNQLAITLGPAANKLFSSFGKAASSAAPAILMVVEALTPLLEAFASLPAPVLATIVGVLAVGATMSKTIGPIVSVGKAVQGLFGILSANPWIILIAGIVTLVVLVVKNWDTIKQVVGAAMEWIGDTIGTVMAAIQGVWDAVWGAISAAVQTAVDLITAYLNIYLVVWNTVFGAAQATISGVVNFITGIPNKIVGAFTGLANLIAAPFKAAFNGIATAWNATVGKLAFKVPGWIPGLGGKGFDVPDIPTFAKGGPIKKGTVGWIGEEGPELFQAGATGFITPTRFSMAAAAQGGGPVGTTVNGPLVQVAQMVVRDDRDIRRVAIELDTETQRGLRAAGAR